MKKIGPLFCILLSATVVSVSFANSSECFSDIEVSFPSTVQGITIAGTLSIPSAKGPFPAILMITGNGPHTRDQMISKSPMFKMLGDHFARQGFVVLRTDARGYGKSTGPNDHEQNTTADRVADNKAAIAFLLSRNEADKGRIILFGHSEGAMIAGALAAADPNIAMTVLLATSALRGDEVVSRQLEGNLTRRGAEPKNAAAVRAQFMKFAKFVVDGGSEGEEFDKLALDFLAAHGVEKEKLDLKLARSLIVGYLKSPWAKYFFSYDPVVDLSRINTPVFAIFGENDTNVPWRVHLPALVDALSHAGSNDHTIRIIPNQDHFFFEFEGKRQEKHTPGKMQIADELFAALDSVFKERGFSTTPCKI